MTSGNRRVIVLGGSWFIGRAIVEVLVRRGYSVITVNRGVTPVWYSGSVERVVADRRKPDEFARTVRAIEAAYLVDVTAYQARDTLAVVKAFGGRLERAVHISTLSVYQSPFPCPVAEDWALESDPRREYGFHKAECERVLFSESIDRFPWTVLRLAPTYGPGDPISRERYFYQRIREGRPVLIPEKPFLCQNVFVEDVALACCQLLESPTAVGRAYNLGAPPFILEDYAGLFSRLLKRPVHLVKARSDVLERSGVDPNRIPYFFEGNLVLKTTRLADEVGFKPRVTLKRGLLKTLAWLATNPQGENHWDVTLERNVPILRTPRTRGKNQNHSLSSPVNRRSVGRGGVTLLIRSPGS